MDKIRDFELHLKKDGLAKNSIVAYLYTINYFVGKYEVNLESILEYKGYLVEAFKPRTVNLRIQGLNSYLRFINRPELCLRTIKIHPKSFLENVVSYSDYIFLKEKLIKDGNLKWYFVVWFLGATGARISELLKIKVEHVRIGYYDVYSKGGKQRRLFIPESLCEECLNWLESQKQTSGYLFLNKTGQVISSRGVAKQLKQFADKYQLNAETIYPHSFRHMFAKQFLEKFNDIALLADLMGHESIETTRIYLRRTASEQQKIVNEIVKW